MRRTKYPFSSFEVKDFGLHEKTPRKSQNWGSFARNHILSPFSIVASPCPKGHNFPNSFYCWFAWQVWHIVTFPCVIICCRKSFSMTGAILLRRFQKLSCTVGGGRITGVFTSTHCQSGLKCWQLANYMARVEHHESALLGGRGSVWCRYVWVWKVVLPNMHMVL